jgi:hypothetical protein
MNPMTVIRKFPQETRSRDSAPCGKSTPQNAVVKMENKTIVQIPDIEFVKPESTMILMVEFPKYGS